MNIKRLARIFDHITTELNAATTLFPGFHSAHEGYAVLLEEVDELWDEVKKNPSKRDMEKLEAEAVQVAAMAIRMVLDVCRDHVD